MATDTQSAFKDLQLERLKFLVDKIKEVLPHLEEIASLSQETRKKIETQIADYAISVRTTRLKPEELEGFFKKPYHIMPVPGREQAWFLIVPRFLDISFGWLHQQTESFNVFLINRYVEWLGGLPEVVKQQLGLKPAPEIQLEGDLLTGKPEDLEEAWRKYRPLLLSKEDEGIRVNKRRSFELLAQLIKDGVLPFTPKPVDPTDIVSRPLSGYEERGYQLDAWKAFQKWSNIGVFWPASVGKTVFALYAMTKLKPPHLVVVPTRLLVEQWESRIETHTDLKLGSEVVVTTYHSAVKRYGDRQWTLMVVDECHHLPANEFVKLSFIKRKYTIGLSATPQREDGREEYIFALTGYPVGLSWDYFRQVGLIKSPTCHVWIVKNLEAKLAKLKSLIEQDTAKTLVFCDSIELGKRIASMLNAPHVYGETKTARLETIENNPVVVVSRVADEGISLPTVERVIEVNWLHGSRRQELQRFTRLLHGIESKSQGEHHILMTPEEYSTDRKRLFSVMDRGFKIEIHGHDTIEQSVSGKKGGLWLRKKSTQPSSESTSITMPAQSSDLSHLLNLPGIRKQLNTLNKKQRELMELLIRSDGTWFTREKLRLVLGYATDDGFRHAMKLPELIERGLVEKGKVNGKTAYRSNISARMGNA
ncbi:MAG: DEAD/DEAH box helicase family protein [Thermoproteota archaeon]